MAANFKADLKRGLQGQALFLKHYPEYEPTTGFNKIDFIHPDGTKVELKTDFYNMNKTKNFFFERYSNDTAGTLGGPFSAAESGVDFFVYFFIKSLKSFWFRPKELCEFLENWEGSKNLIEVPNKGYTTLGIKCNRDLVKHLCIKEETWE